MQHVNRKSLKAMDVIMLLLGNVLLAFDVAAFIVPHDFILGGTTGIAIFAGHFFNIDTALLVLCMNIALLLVGRFVLGRKLFLSTIVSSVLYPVLLGLFQRIPGIDSITDNTLLAALFGGSLLGIALGLVMRIGASTGGMDIVALLMNKFLHWSVSTCVWITDLTVIFMQALFSPVEGTLYAIIILVVESLLIDRLMIIGLPQIQIFAVSERYEQIRRALLEEVDVGVTMVNIETGCLGKPQLGILCIIPQRKLFDAVSCIQSVDNTAFLTITQIKEARGRGYTLEQDSKNLAEVFADKPLPADIPETKNESTEG